MSNNYSIRYVIKRLKLNLFNFTLRNYFSKGSSKMNKNILKVNDVANIALRNTEKAFLDEYVDDCRVSSVKRRQSLTHCVTRYVATW